MPSCPKTVFPGLFKHILDKNWMAGHVALSMYWSHLSKQYLWIILAVFANSHALQSCSEILLMQHSHRWQKKVEFVNHFCLGIWPVIGIFNLTLVIALVERWCKTWRFLLDCMMHIFKWTRGAVQIMVHKEPNVWDEANKTWFVPFESKISDIVIPGRLCFGLDFKFEFVTNVWKREPGRKSYFGMIFYIFFVLMAYSSQLSCLLMRMRNASLMKWLL